MSPSKLETGLTFNTTESMAEWAWRYGEAGVPHTPIGFGLLEFEDGSCMSPRYLHSAIGWRSLWGVFRGTWPVGGAVMTARPAIHGGKTWSTKDELAWIDRIGEFSVTQDPLSPRQLLINALAGIQRRGHWGRIDKAAVINRIWMRLGQLSPEEAI